jgi:small subunit ribosomal protein S27Ae
MQILVQTLTGKKCEITAESTSNVASISSQIESQMGIPVESQRLLCNGKKLDSEMILSGIASSEELNFYLVVELDGGAKGKKKKKLVKKNKKPHKHLKNKLAILSYYKVDGDNVVRVRQQCKICPPGTYLADHEERLYCGRCHTGYQKTGDAKKKAKKEVKAAVVEVKEEVKKGKKAKK